MNSVTVSLSSGQVLENTSEILSELNIKGQTLVTLDLTKLNEKAFSVATLVIDWGDGSSKERYSKDLVVDYKTQSIFSELLYGKIGSIAVQYTHNYVTLPDRLYTTYPLNIIIYYENGYSYEFSGDINAYPESFYDSVKDIKLISTQILATSDNYTVANFEGANNNTFITILEAGLNIADKIPIGTAPPGYVTLLQPNGAPIKQSNGAPIYTIQ